MSKPYIQSLSLADAHKADIFSVATTDKYTISASADGTIKLWENNDSNPAGKELATNAVGFHHVATDTNGDILAVVAFDGTLSLFDLRTLEPIATKINDEVSGIWAVAISGNGHMMAVTNTSGHVFQWNLETDELVHKFPVTRPSHGICVDFSQCGEYISSGHENGGLYLFSTNTGRLMYSLLGHSTPIRSVKISPNSSLLAVGDDSGIVYLYHISSGEYYTNLTGHDTWVMAVSWNESGEYVLSGSYDGKMKVWSTENKTCVCTQTALTTPVFSVAWLKKGWGLGVIGGKNQGFVAGGVGKNLVWCREAAGE